MTDTNTTSENSILKGASDAISNISQYIWETQEHTGSLVSDQKMLALGDTLQGVLKESSVKIPKIVAVGTQSSGKSSVLNSLIGMDILPTGRDMVTRTPLHLEVIHSSNKESLSYAEFGDYEDGSWKPSEKTAIHYPKPTDCQKERISNIILDITKKKAGNQMDISSEAIHLRIVSPNVTNLSLIDLPGLTAVACTDRGQPKDIKNRLENMVGSFIDDENTLILGIIAGRSDLEADMGLELVKKYDPQGTRTVGVLTKLDLMNDPNDIVKYLEGRISKDLQLKHGYFAIRNRNQNEKNTLSVEEGLDQEKQFFQKQAQLGKKTISSQVGIPSLKAYLAHLLTNAIKVSLPRLQAKISSELNEVLVNLGNLGEALPTSNEMKASFTNNLLVEFCQNFNHYTLSRGSPVDTGRKLKDNFVSTREQLSQLNPFENNVNYSDQELQKIIANSEGNHMTFPYPPVEILEKCLQNEKTTSLQLYKKPLQTCLQETTNILVKLVDTLVSESNINRFPELKHTLKTLTLQNVIIPNSVICQKMLNELVDAQINYIWTDNPEFHNCLLEFGKGDLTNDLIPSLRSLLNQYTKTVGNILSDVGPKCIMYYYIKKCTESLYSTIYTRLSNENNEKLLLEDSDVEIKRQSLMNLKNELETALKTIENIS